MAAETDRVEPAESEQDEGEDVYEVERIIDMRVEEGEVLYRVRWKNYCSDDDTWEPEAHLEDCREVLLTFKKALTEAKAKKEAEAKAKKEAEAKKSMKVLPTKSDLFDADSSDSDKDRPTDLPVKKKKKKQVEEPSPKEKKKKKKAKRQEDIRPLPAPETDEEDEPAPTPPPSPKKPEPKKQLDSEDEDQDPVPTKKHKKDKGKAAGKQKQRAEEGKKRKGKKEAKIETSDDDTAPIEEDISEGLSETQTDDTSTEGLKTAERIYLDDKFKEKKGKWEVKLQGFKDLIQKKESKKPDASPKESSLQKLKALTSKAKEDPAPHSSDSSDSSTAHKKTKSKDSTAPPKAQAAPSVPSVPTEVKSKAKEEKTKEDILAQKDTAGSTNLFEKFLLNCEAKDRAPRRPSVHQPPPEKSASKPIKLIGKIEKIPKPSKDSPVQKPEPERTEKVKLTEAAPVSKAGQTYGFSLDSDEREVEFSPKGRPSDEARKERPEEAQRSGWDRRSSTDSKPRRREDSEPRLFMACEDPPESQEPPEPSDKTEKSQATLSLGMDLNLDWMTLDDFQKHLNGEDEVLSGPPLSPSELRDAVKSGDYLAVKLALNSKEDYNLDQEESTFGQKNCVAEERGSSDILSSSLNLVDKRNKRRVAHVSTRSMTAEIAMGDTEQSNPTDTCELASKLRRLRRKNNENNAKVKVNESCEEDAHHFVSNDKSGSNVMVKRHQPKRKIQTTLPTRTGLRTRKKEDKLDPSTEKEQKKQLGKKHVCFYCKIAFTQLSKHLEKIHAEETDVARALHFPKASKTRQTLLDQIRNKGDYEHNCKVVKSGEGEIIPKKQVKNTTASVEDFLPCQYCFAFYRKSELWRHKRLCKAKKEDVEPAERAKKGRVHSAASRLLPVSEFLTGGCEEIIHVMHQDDISRRIRNDPLICKYGNALSVKYDHDKSQFPYIAQKMRELGRFVVAVNELDSSVQFLQEICLPSRFELAVEGAKKASGFDPSSSTFKTASLVSKIGYSLKRAAEIAFGESRMKEDSESETEIKTFIDLLDTKWNDYFSHTALASAQKEEVKKMDTSTVTADLLKLHLFITQEEEEARKDILQNPSLATWKKLSEATLADVCLFNRIRVGNIGRLLLETYTSKKSTGKFLPSAEQMRKSTKLELELSERLTRLELEGQFGRSMLILLTQRMVSLINLLIEHREQVGVSSNNIYLFARSEGPSFIRGLDCLRRAAVECAVVNPEALLCPSLREQIASSWQLLSLCESELGQVAKLLGRSSQECSELSKNAILVEEVGKQLLQMHQILPSGTTGSAKEGAQSKSAVKRRPWSEKEQAAVKRFLSEFITKMKVPGKKECNACLAAEPDLCRRSWTDVKNFVHNTLQTLRRRQNQPEKPKTERSTVNPKRQKAVAQITKKHFEVNNNIACNLTTNLNDTTSMSITASSHVIEQSILFPLDMTSGYQSFCSGNSNMVCPSPTSSFSSLNVLDTQVVPTYTPLTTTNPVMHPLYSPDSRFLPPMSPSYTHNPSSIPPPSVYSPQDTDSLILPTFTSLNCPSTSMLPTYTSLNTAVFPPYSTINDRNDFASLDHSSTSFPTSPIGPSTSSQVVPTVHAPTGGPADVEEGMSAPSEHLSSLVKAQKRNKRLWSEEEQAAVRRQLGDFCELVRVPGKRDCDACLAAEPALNTRTWREVKYFVHNSIQSVKRRGTEMSPNESDMMEQETHSDWDAPVYLSL